MDTIQWLWRSAVKALQEYEVCEDMTAQAWKGSSFFELFDECYSHLRPYLIPPRGLTTSFVATQQGQKDTSHRKEEAEIREPAKWRDTEGKSYS